MENFGPCPAAPIRQPRFFSLSNPSPTDKPCLQRISRLYSFFTFFICTFIVQPGVDITRIKNTQTQILKPDK
ncbi:hypothetical protein EAN55_08580 [Escherichia albertii]|nr:hypothetical protein [Escherichia albertii]